jgi:hypothetical protein
MRRLVILLALAASLAGWASLAEAQRPLLVGAAEDASKQPQLSTAVVKMDLARLAGLTAVRVTSLWTPGKTAPSDYEALLLQNAATAAALNGIRLFVSVYPRDGTVVPRTPASRAQFASFAASIARRLPTVDDVIVGNEPNLNRFWLPQFDRQGRDTAAPEYELLLAKTYDALKAVDPTLNVIGGAISPRGSDRPGIRPTHSPTTFIQDLGRAYRNSQRTRPIMDVLAFHPYLETSKLPPTFSHPRGKFIALNDYSKLVYVLGQAFGGTAQPGATLPILYDEFGVQSRIVPAKAHLYSHWAAPVARDVVPEATQAAYYREALALTACQPTVVGMLLFHVSDESDLRAWQSGLYYSDDTPKSSLEPVREATEAARTDTLAPLCSLPWTVSGENSTQR